jgi:hypothetical protein
VPRASRPKHYAWFDWDGVVVERFYTLEAAFRKLNAQSKADGRSAGYAEYRHDETVNKRTVGRPRKA